MFPYCLCGILLILCTGQCLGQDLQLPALLNGTVGESVKFVPDSPPLISSEFALFTWAFGSQIILRFNPVEIVFINPLYQDRVTLNITTFALELMKLTLNDTGEYSLNVIIDDQMYTRQTSLKVYEKVSNTTLIGPEETLIEGLSNANLTSKGSGTITSVQWLKNNDALIPSDNITFSSDHRSVLISPVVRSDSGEYQCTLSNPASFETAKFTLIINYGPDDVVINGPKEVDLGRTVSLSCSATSVPAATFTWTFNGTDTNVTTNTFTIEKIDFIHNGDYICTAQNNVTNKNAVSQSYTLVVQVDGGGDDGGDGGGGGLTTGAIVGIVFAALVAVAGICGLIVYLTKTNKITKVSLGKNKPANADNYRQEHELNYAEINHKPKTSRQGVVQGPVDDSRTTYAEITHGASGKPRAPPPPYGSQASNPPSLPEEIVYAKVQK